MDPLTANGFVTGKIDRSQIRRTIHLSASFNPGYGLMNGLAAVVAAYGLLSNSTAVVIGAMIIATLMGPITGISLALVDGERRLLRKALVAEIGGAALVFALSYGIGWLHRDIPLGREVLSRTSPNIMDLLIALAAGAAGAYAAVSPQISAGLVGVAVATALVPPLAVSGITLARGDFSLSFGGFLFYFANLVAIQVASSVVLWLAGFQNIIHPTENGRSILSRHWLSLGILLSLMAVFGINFQSSVAHQAFESRARKALEKGFAEFPGVHLSDVRFDWDSDSVAVRAVIQTPYSFHPERVQQIKGLLPQLKDRAVGLSVISVIIKETTPQGYLHLQEQREEQKEEEKKEIITDEPAPEPEQRDTEQAEEEEEKEPAASPPPEEPTGDKESVPVKPKETEEVFPPAPPPVRTDLPPVQDDLPLVVE